MDTDANQNPARRPWWTPRRASDDSSHLPVRELLEVARTLHGSLDLESTLRSVVDHISTATGFRTAALNLRRGERYDVVAIAGDKAVRQALAGTSFTAQTLEGQIALGRQWGEVCLIRNEDQPIPPTDVTLWIPEMTQVDHRDAWHPLDILLVPLTDSRGEHVGMLCVDSPADGLRPTVRQVEMLEIFAHHAGIAIEHAQLYAELEKQRQELDRSATIDHLTGLRNRTVFDREVPTLMTQRGQEVVVLVLDLDGFKAVNDEGGHHVGDVVLSTVATRMRAALRDGDLLARTGGDEFVVVGMADNAREQAAGMSLRLEQAVREPVVIDGQSWQVGVSIGTATSATPADAAEMLAAADAAMYDVKRARRTGRTTGQDGFGSRAGMSPGGGLT